VLIDLIRGAFASYEKPIDHALNLLERFEMGVFGAEGSSPFEVQQGYYLKRQASVFKRMLRLSMDLLPRIAGATPEPGSPVFQDLREEAEAQSFYADDLMEGVNGLLNLHISMASQRTNEASHRTNEVVRVLTIFSVFLLPLNLVVGFYGMNFEHLSGLRSEHGVLILSASMVLKAIGIWIWFRHKGWLEE
jgi:magnesium transporter